jgi:GNAT superfamily N-acetyltransferase
MSRLEIREADSYEDAVIISDHITEIWNNDPDKNIYSHMKTYIDRYGKGFLIASLSGKNIGSSVAFPMDHITDFDEVNNNNIYDLINPGGGFYYIHIIQILPEFRDRGFGIKVLKYQLETARTENFHTVTGMGIDRELGLWEKCGFVSFGEFGNYKNFGRFKWLKMSL